jgi:3-deoxy-D-manno-octulosonate 8-phosphate phosphatase (KDO 8-P phosphatase)
MMKFLIMDVDGTLTDGKIYIGETGEAFKAFDIKDGCGIKDILPQYGIIPLIITARKSVILENRCKELGIEYLYQGEREKFHRLNSVIEQYNDDNSTEYTLADCAYIGDDILDLQCMEPIKEAGGIVGCPLDAVPKVKAVADFVSIASCGRGAVREFIDFLVAGENKSQYAITRQINKTIEYLRQLDLKNMQVGRYPLDEKSYYMIQEYTTKAAEECKLESHKRYIDIQWMLDGEEKIQVSDIYSLEMKVPYDSEKDLMFWKDRSYMTEIILKSDSYVVLYPENAHKPAVMVDKPIKVKKLVAKIAV